MDFSDPYMQLLGIVIAAVMAAIAGVNWLNRRHGGFLRGWAGGVFIAICWFGVIGAILLRLNR